MIAAVTERSKEKTMLIEETKTLLALYGDLLVAQRDHNLKIQSGKAKCLYCDNSKELHIPDGRCSSWALSRTFQYVCADEMAKIDKALTLIEGLRGLKI